MMTHVLFMTVGTGVGNTQKGIDSLAHGLLFSIYETKPDYIIFFGSELSKKTIESLKIQYREKFDKDLENYEFVLLNRVDNFDDCFEKMKDKILEFKDCDIKMDYTSGTKTMTMTAAICSVLYRKDLILVGGKRKDGIVIKGTEEKKTQNLYQAYDKLTIDKIKEFFNNNRFESAKELLKDITILDDDKHYLDLINSYSSWDKFNHELAIESFENKKFSSFTDMKDQLEKNAKALNIINRKNDKKRCYYILADLLNNAIRRAEEGKYDDAIARLYRSLELIAQIRLEKGYKLKTSHIDIEKVKKLANDKKYVDNLEKKKYGENAIKLGLSASFELLEKLNDDVGIEFKKCGKKRFSVLSHRNMSILAHGLESKTYDEYLDFKEIVFSLANFLNSDIDIFINESKFPRFSI